MAEGPQRRLAAIVSSDVVGYTRLMEADEAGTHARLKARFKALVDPKIAEHGGRVVKLMGDGLLAEFPSVVDAVNWAVDVQAKVAELSAEAPDEPRIEYRVGVNLGDVIVDGDDIFGDGVNVAARLQEIAEPGAVCISEKVQAEVRGKLGVAFADGGARVVKNITDPIRVWRWSPGQAEASDPAPQSFADKPSIAVLPFDNMSGDPEQEYFADGIAEDIITELARFPDLMVIARNSTFTYKGHAVKVQEIGRELGVRYVLEGSVRKDGQRVRITAQLVDGKTGVHIWAERYDRALTDIFEVQDEITQTVVANVPERIATAELDRGKRKLPDDMSAYDYVLRGKQHHHRSTPEDNAEALRLLDAAIELDPEYASAYAWKACILAQAIALGCGGDPQELLARDHEAVLKGLSLDANDIECHRILCEFGMMWSQWDEAQRHHDKAFELNPNDARIIAQRGELLTMLGQAEEGIAWVQKAIRLDPYNAEARAHLLGRAMFAAHRYADAIVAFKRLPAPRPDHFADMAACFAQLEQSEEARVYATKVVTLRPDFSINDYVERRAFLQPGDQDHLRDCLLRSGLPE